MIVTHARKTRERAQQVAFRHGWLNAIHVALAFNLLPLLALHYGAGDLAMGVLYAGVYVTGLAAALVPLLLSGRETSAIWARSWELRTLFILVWLGLPWLPPGPVRIGVLLLSYYGFLCLRTVALNVHYSVIRSISTPAELPAFAARSAARSNLGLLLGSVAAFALLQSRLLGDERAMLTLIGVGAAANFLSARALHRLPETGFVEPTSPAGMRQVIAETFRHPLRREVMVLEALGSALLVSLSYAVNHLKHEAGFGTAQVFLVTTAGLAVRAGAAQLLRMVTGYTQPRTLLFGAGAWLTVMGAAWTVAGTWGPAGGLAGYLAAFCLTSLGVAVLSQVLVQQQASRLPETHSVQVTLLFQLSAMLGSLLTLPALGVMRRLLAGIALPGLHAYSHVFALWTGISGLILWRAWRLRPGADTGKPWTLGEELRLLTLPNLLTMYQAYRSDRATTRKERELHMESALLRPTRLSRRLLIELLHSSDVARRMQAYQMLVRIPLRAAFAPVLAEAASPDSPLRAEAVTALGFLGLPAAIPSLRPLVNHPNPLLRATAVKTLLRLGEPLGDEAVAQVYEDIGFERFRLEVLAGLVSTGRTDLLARLVAQSLQSRPDGYAVRSLFLYASEALGRRDTMIEIYDAERSRPGDGIACLLREFKGVIPVKAVNRDVLAGLLEAGDVRSFIDHLFPECGPAELRNSVFDRDSALGFTAFCGMLAEETALTPPSMTTGNA